MWLGRGGPDVYLDRGGEKRVGDLIYFGIIVTGLAEGFDSLELG